MQSECVNEDVITPKEARIHLFTILKHEFIQHDNLRDYIKQVIPDKTEMSSIRGYWMFQHAKFKKDVIDLYNYYDMRRKR